MEAIYALVVIGLAIFSIVNLMSHMGNHGNLKKEHEEVMSRLQSSRRMTHSESESFKEVFKAVPPASAKVYKHRGIVSFIGIEVNHAEQKEFSIGGIRIHNKAYSKLAKKKIGMNLEDYIPDPKLLETDIQNIQKKMDDGTLSEEQLKKEVEALKDEKMSHDFEFVFLKEENPGKQAAFLLSLGDWKLTDCRQS